MRLLPGSLFGRLALVLFGGLLVAQLLGAAIYLAERDQLLVRATGMQSAQRIADVVKLLDVVGGAERQRIAGIFNQPPLTVRLMRDAPAESGATGAGAGVLLFSTVLRAALGDERPIRVRADATASAGTPGFGPPHHPGMMGGPGAFSGMHPMQGSGPRFAVQVRLLDGSWAAFDSQVAGDSAGISWRLVVTLLVLLAAVLLLSLLAVRWLTRPLNLLADAAETLGRDIHRPPLPEQGPQEVRRAAHAFNTMQTRLIRIMEDRARLLTAMSHDLKTPITRMRLRAELLDDDEQRLKFEKDLLEMEAMVAQTLDFMRGLGHEAQQPVDLMALVARLRADQLEMGRTLTVTGQVATPISGMPLMLRRCLGNLLDNAALHGMAAHVTLTDGRDQVTIGIRDDGPGIAEPELERVFEPFYRLEGSRNRATGGTGLGLGIARDIARAHGGDLRLQNAPQGGLEAVLTLARR